MPSTSNNYNANRNNNSNTINENFDAAPFRQNKNNYYNYQNNINLNNEIDLCIEKPLVVTIPARTIEVIKLRVYKVNTEYAICPAIKLSKSVTLPSAVVKPINNLIVTTIRNTSNEDLTIVLPTVKLEEYNEYNYTINYVQGNKNDFNYNERLHKIQENLRLDHLNEEEKLRIEKLCMKFSDIFYLEGDKLTFTNQIKHEINTESNIPIFSKTYRYPHIHKDEVKRQISEMLDQNIIQPSVSPWSSPVWVVPKKLIRLEFRSGE